MKVCYESFSSVHYKATLAYTLVLIQKTYQFINVVNGVSRSHKTANIFFTFDLVACSPLTGMYIKVYNKAIHLLIIPNKNSLVTY